MFGRVFGKRAAAPAPNAAGDDPATRALMQTIAERSATDPQIGAKLGAKDVLHRLTTTMMKADAKGVHAETLVAILGSLAGYACVVSAVAYVEDIRRQLAGPGRAQALANLSGMAPIMTVGGKDGRTYLTGDAINGPLFEAQYSVRNVVCGRAPQYGVAELPDAAELAVHVIKTMGTSEFGVPRLRAGEHAASEPPISYVRAFWPVMLPIVRLYCPRESDGPLLFALAAQEAIDLCKATLAPATAMRLALECAVPMSRISPTELQ
jgi:hypothetical protein